MSSVSPSLNANQIILSESLSQSTRHIVELSKAYQTVILIYEDDLSDKVLAAWAETDRLNLKLRKIGQVLNGIEVCSFGMNEFRPNTILELSLRESSQDPNRQDFHRSAYKSLLNDLILIQVKVHNNIGDSLHLQ